MIVLGRNEREGVVVYLERFEMERLAALRKMKAEVWAGLLEEIDRDHEGATIRKVAVELNDEIQKMEEERKRRFDLHQIRQEWIEEKEKKK